MYALISSKTGRFPPPMSINGLVRQQRTFGTLIRDSTPNNNHQQQSSTLATRGWIALREPVLSRASVVELREKLPLLFRGHFDTGVYPDEMHWREGISKAEAPREIVNAWKADRTVAAVVLSQSIGKLAATLAGWTSVRIAQDDIVWKPPGSGPVAYHQDSAYISRQFVPAANNSITLWIALDDCDEEVGTIEYATFAEQGQPPANVEPNSRTPMPTFHGATALNYRRPAEAVAESEGLCARFDAIDVPTGCAVVHAQDSWHGSAPNVSANRHRRALAVHFLRGDAQFIDGHPLTGTRGPSYIYARYKRLDSTELSEESFPITFSENGYLTSWIPQYLGHRSSPRN